MLVWILAPIIIFPMSKVASSTAGNKGPRVTLSLPAVSCSRSSKPGREATAVFLAAGREYAFLSKFVNDCLCESRTAIFLLKHHTPALRDRNLDLWWRTEETLCAYLRLALFLCAFHYCLQPTNTDPLWSATRI